MFTLPKGRSFSKRIYGSMVVCGAVIGLFALYVFINNDGKGRAHKARTEIDTQHSSEQIKKIKQQKPEKRLVNAAITKKAIALPQIRNTDFKPGDIVYVDGKPYRVDAQGQLQPFDGVLQQGQRVYKDGQWYAVDASGNLVPTDEGVVATINGKAAIFKNGQWHEVDASGNLIPIKAGAISTINGKPFVLKNGKWVPLSEAGFKPGDIVYQDGKPYIVDANGELKPFTGKLQKGQRVYQNGKWYEVDGAGNLTPIKEGTISTIDGKPFVLKNGQWVPLSELGLKAGDIVYQDGKPYIIDEDGKLQLTDQLKPGQIVYKDGQLWQVDKDSNLKLLPNGETILDTQSRPYRIHNNSLVSFEPCEIIRSKDEIFIVGHDYKLYRFEEGNDCINEAFGGGVKMQDGKVIEFKLPKDKAKQSIAPSQQEQTKKDKEAKTKALWEVNFNNKNNETLAAMKAPIEVIRNQDRPKNKATPKTELSFEEAMAKEQANIKAIIADQQNSNPYATQNNQSSKIAFLKAAQQKGQGALDSIVQASDYPYTLSVGSFIPATLISGINSDLPGAIIAQVSRNVYDTRTGDHLLIPQGTKLFGQYDSQISYGQSRVIMVWSKLTFPDASTYDLQGMPGADLSGFAGISDKVNNHYFKVFGSALLFSLFGAGSQLTQPNSNGSGQSNSQLIYGAIGQQMTQAATKQIENNMQIQPTLTIRQGTHFNILATREMVFDQPYQFDVHYTV